MKTKITEITEIKVDKLFGYYNYELIKSHDTMEPLLILYGDNGTGKTTILNMLISLLSPVPGEGFKTQLANIKFSKFSIKFSNGLVIVAKREEPTLIGSYTVSINENGEISEFLCKADEDNTIRQNANDPHESGLLLLKKLKSLNLSIIHLSDSRRLTSFEDNNHEDIDWDIVQKELYIPSSRHIKKIKEDRRQIDINASISLFEKQIKNNVLNSTKIGDKNTNSIYSELLKRVSRSTNKVNKDDLSSLLDKLTEIKIESDKYFELGLLSELEVQEIQNTITNNIHSDLKSELLFNILDPYIELLRSRLDALKPIYETIKKFISSVNDYFPNKYVEYNLSNGFTLKDRFIAEPINFTSLSSGEKQLIILLCNVVNESENASILIIDEPEISLNVKWQRKLIHTLLELSEGKNVQFVFSSHSIELLSSHRKSVCKLVHIEK